MNSVLLINAAGKESAVNDQDFAVARQVSLTVSSLTAFSAIAQFCPARYDVINASGKCSFGYDEEAQAPDLFGSSHPSHYLRGLAIRAVLLRVR